MKTINSAIGRLGQSDAIKAFWMFLYSTVIGIVGDAIMQAVVLGHYSFSDIHWREIASAIVVAVLAYLKKQISTNSQGELYTKEPIEK